MVRLHGRAPAKRDREAEKPLLPLAIGELKDEPTGRVTLQPDHDFAHSDTREKARKIPGIKVLESGKDNSCRLKATILFLIALAFAATATCLVVWRVYYNGDQCPPGQLRKGNRCFFSIHRTPGTYYPRPSPEHSSAAKNNFNAEKGLPSHRHTRPEGRHPDEVRNRLEAVATLHPPSPDRHKMPVLKTEHWYPKPFYHVETGFFPPEWLKPRPTKHAHATSTHDHPPKVIQKPTEVPRTRVPFRGVWEALGLTTTKTVVPTPTQPAVSTKHQQTTTLQVTTVKPTTTRSSTSVATTTPTARPKTTPISTTKMVLTTTTTPPPPPTTTTTTSTTTVTTTKVPVVTTTAPQSTTKTERVPEIVTTYQLPQTTKPHVLTTTKPATTSTKLAQESTPKQATEPNTTTKKLLVTTVGQSSTVTPSTTLPPVPSTPTSHSPDSGTTARKTTKPVNNETTNTKKNEVITATVSQMKPKTTVETSTITPKSDVVAMHTARFSTRGTTVPTTYLPTVTTDIATEVNQMQGDQPIQASSPVKVTTAVIEKQTIPPTADNVFPSPTSKVSTESAVQTTPMAEKKTTTPLSTKHTVPDQKTYQTVPMVKIIQEAVDVTTAPDVRSLAVTRQASGANETHASKQAPVIQPEVAKPTSVITTLAPPQPVHLSTRPPVAFVATPTAHLTPWHAINTDDTTVTSENASSLTAAQEDKEALETAIMTSSTPVEFFTATESMTPKVQPDETKQSTPASLIKSTAKQEE